MQVGGEAVLLLLGSSLQVSPYLKKGTSLKHVSKQYNVLKLSDFRCGMYREREQKNEKTLQNLNI